MKQKKKIHIKKGDTVQIISGSQKSKIGIVDKVLTKTNQIIIQNFNLKIKHIRPSQQEESGKIINIEAPIHSSNVMLYSKKDKIRSRYNIKINDNQKKIRVLKKNGEIIK